MNGRINPAFILPRERKYTWVPPDPPRIMMTQWCEPEIKMDMRGLKTGVTRTEWIQICRKEVCWIFDGRVPFHLPVPFLGADQNKDKKGNSGEELSRNEDVYGMRKRNFDRSDARPISIRGSLFQLFQQPPLIRRFACPEFWTASHFLNFHINYLGWWEVSINFVIFQRLGAAVF